MEVLWKEQGEPILRVNLQALSAIPRGAAKSCTGCRKAKEGLPGPRPDPSRAAAGTGGCGRGKSAGRRSASPAIPPARCLSTPIKRAVKFSGWKATRILRRQTGACVPRDWQATIYATIQGELKNRSGVQARADPVSLKKFPGTRRWTSLRKTWWITGTNTVPRV